MQVFENYIDEHIKFLNTYEVRVSSWIEIPEEKLKL